MVDGAAAERLSVIDVFGLGAGASPVEAEVPFAEHGGGVAVRLEKRGDGGAAGFDERWTEALEYALFEATAPSVAARQERVAARRAKRGRGVGVGEAEAFAGEAIHVRGLPRAGGVVSGDVADAEVVGEDVDDVGRRGGVEGGAEQQGEEQARNHLVVRLCFSA